MGFSKMQKMAENGADPVIVDKDGISSLVIAECSYEVIQILRSKVAFHSILYLYFSCKVSEY